MNFRTYLKASPVTGQRAGHMPAEGKENFSLEVPYQHTSTMSPTKARESPPMHTHPRVKPKGKWYSRFLDKRFSYALIT